MEKRCTKCGEVKPLSEFDTKPSKNGRIPISVCKVCRRKKHAAWVAKNREKYLRMQRGYAAEHREKRKENMARWKSENHERYRELQRAWRIKNKAHIAEQARIRRATNPHALIANRLSPMIRKQVTKVGAGKSKKSVELLGCSIEEFKKYLESKFKPGMCWERATEWHIDHIRPCCTFDLTDPEQQKQCFHYTNLQPLWAHENLVKHKKWEPSTTQLENTQNSVPAA